MAEYQADRPQVPRRPGVGRWAIVIVLALPLLVAGIIVLRGVLVGTWSIDANVEVPEGLPERIATLREAMAATDAAPTVVAWLDAALEPGIDGADMLAYLRTALEELEGLSDPQLVGAEQELREIVAQISHPGEGYYTPAVTIPSP